MAKNYLTLILAVVTVFIVRNSITRIHVHGEIPPHHIRHFHHHMQQKSNPAGDRLHRSRIHREHRDSPTEQPRHPVDILLGHGHGRRVERPDDLSDFLSDTRTESSNRDSRHAQLRSLGEDHDWNTYHHPHHQQHRQDYIRIDDNDDDEAEERNDDEEVEREETKDDTSRLAESAAVVNEQRRRITSAGVKNDRTENVKCPKCTGMNNVRVSEEELTELRIEYVKNQILQKLRLKERPQISVGDLPRPIYDGMTIPEDMGKQSKDLDDYYARTSQKFIFLEQERTQCNRFNYDPSICFQFKIEGDIDSIDVSTAELWIYKHPNKGDLTKKQTFVVSELEASHDRDDLPKAKPIAIQSIGTEAGWIKIDVAWATKQWFANRQLSHIIQIACRSCEMHQNETLISTEKAFRPFILIDTLNRRKIRRQKRNVNCSVGVTECCREKLYISFAEIGWDDWILQPSGYDAYFCRGSCSTAASIAMSNSHYSSVLRKVIYQRKNKGDKALELIPCCTAKKFSSLQLVYMDSNNTGTVKTLPNMVVESCGCM